jgi:hypothetical protein
MAGISAAMVMPLAHQNAPWKALVAPWVRRDWRATATIDGRTTRHAGHVTSLRIRKRIEEPFGWMKTVAGGRKLRYIGLQRNRAWFLMIGAVYNLIRIIALDAQGA